MRPPYIYHHYRMQVAWLQVKHCASGWKGDTSSATFNIAIMHSQLYVMQNNNYNNDADNNEVALQITKTDLLYLVSCIVISLYSLQVGYAPHGLLHLQECMAHEGCMQISIWNLSGTSLLISAGSRWGKHLFQITPNQLLPLPGWPFWRCCIWHLMHVQVESLNQWLKEDTIQASCSQ